MNSIAGRPNSCGPIAKQHRGAPNPHGPQAPWDGSPSRTNRAETCSSCAEVYPGVLGPLRLHGAKTELTLAGGTEGSNPSPSSGESGANLAFGGRSQNCGPGSAMARVLRGCFALQPRLRARQRLAAGGFG